MWHSEDHGQIRRLDAAGPLNTEQHNGENGVKKKAKKKKLWHLVSEQWWGPTEPSTLLNVMNVSAFCHLIHLVPIILTGRDSPCTQCTEESFLQPSWHLPHYPPVDEGGGKKRDRKRGKQVSRLVHALGLSPFPEVSREELGQRSFLQISAHLSHP